MLALAARACFSTLDVPAAPVISLIMRAITFMAGIEFVRGIYNKKSK
jgi:hypothetical protein